MNKGKVKLSFSLFLLSLFIFLASVYTVYGTWFTVSSPTSGTVYSTRLIDFNITTAYQGVANCSFSIGLSNGTVLSNASMTNTSSTRNAFYNTSYNTLIDSSLTGSHNVTFYCDADGDGTYEFASDVVTFGVRATRPTLVSPTNTSYSYRGVLINFTTGSSISGTCNYTLGLSNGTSILYPTTNTSNVWGNSSAFSSLIDGTHNLTANCSDSSSGSPYSSETTIFTISSATPILASPTNASTSSSAGVLLNITTGSALETGYNCSYRFGNSTSGSYGSWTNLTNTTTGRNIWNNASAFSTGTDSNYSLWHNVTFRCNDSTSGSPYTSSTYLFKVDTANPSLTAQDWTVSASSFVANVSVTDQLHDTCKIRIYNSSGYKTTELGTWGTAQNARQCTGSVDGSLLFYPVNTAGGDMTFSIDYWANDTTAHSGTSANQTGIAKKIYTGWNIISELAMNTTSGSLCSMISGCSQISWFNNTAGNKSFITYSTSTPSINNATAIDNETAVLVYVSADTWFLQRNRVSDWVGTSTENVTLNTGGWNVMGLPYSATINTTLYALTFNATYVTPAQLTNITWISYLNGSTYITCKTGWSICAGTTLGPQEITLPQGTGVWALTNANVTLNRTRISG